MANFINTLTKDQVLHVYSFAGATEVPTGDGEIVLPVPAEAVSIHITIAPGKSVYGKTLYFCEHVPTEPRFLSFDRGIVRSVYPAPLEEQVIDRCINLNQGCTVLDENLHVLATCKFNGNRFVYAPGALTHRGNPA